MSRFAGQAFLVTGASSGIGLACARRIAAEDGTVVAVARDPARLRAMTESIPGTGHRAVVADASCWEQMEPAIAIGRELGGYAGGVFCAGAHHVKPLSLVDADHLRGEYDANVVTALHATKVVARAPRASGASLVWLSSVAAWRATAGFTAYAAAKGGLLSAARVVAAELASRRIRVNTIIAGVVATAMSEAWLAKLTPEQQQAVARAHLLGIGQPEQVASAAAFLLSDDASWMTGSELVVDGGLTVR